MKQAIHTIDELDIVDLLELDRAMTPGELDDFLEAINKEVWFRIGQQKLHPNNETIERVKTVTEEVKKEFVLNFLQRLVKKYRVVDEMNNTKETLRGQMLTHLHQAVNELKKEVVDFKKVKERIHYVLRYRDLMYRS